MYLCSVRDHESCLKTESGNRLMRVLVCDDNRLLLDAMTIALTDRGHTVVATALDPDGAVAAAREHQPDVCLLAMSSPRNQGFSAIARIHAVSPDTQVVVMWSGSNGGGLVTDAIGRGAQGFVGKENTIGVIIEALELANEGSLTVDPLVLRDVFRPRAEHDDPLLPLTIFTECESEALRCLVDGLSTEQMADLLGVRPSTARALVQKLAHRDGHSLAAEADRPMLRSVFGPPPCA